MKSAASFLFLGLAIVVLFAVNLLVGSVHIPVSDVVSILAGHTDVRPSWQFIVIGSRLPAAITATFCGAALSASGLMLQTAFRNPLAGPSVFGINSGAGVGVAIVMLSPATLSLQQSAGSTFLVLAAAFVGAMLVMGIIFFFSTRVRNAVMLLIIGIMIGFIADSAISLLNFFATEEGVKSYMVWGLGNFTGVSLDRIPLFVVLTLVGLCGALLLIKPLNALLLGERYAENLGVNTLRLRNQLLFVTGLLTAVATAYCGPISFIGLAVPHMTRLLIGTGNHRILLPATMLMGSLTALVCNVICFLPGEGGIIPLNVVTPIIGAPVIIYVITRNFRH